MSPVTIEDDAQIRRTEALLVAAKLGDPGARWGVLEACRDYLQWLACRQRISRIDLGADPSDLVQDAMIEGWRCFPGFRGQTLAQLRVWLRVILMRRVFRSGRRPDGKGLLDSLEFGGGIAADIETPSAIVRGREADQSLEEAMGRLPDHYRAVIRLRVWHDFSFTEIGSTLGCSEEAARKLYTRAIRRLRELLGMDEDPR